MNRKSTGVPESCLDSLSGCLVEGDPLQRRWSQTVHRRAILLSIFLQSTAIAALIIFPLFGKGERIPVRIFVERPPFRLGANHPRSSDQMPREHSPTQPCLFCRQTFAPGKAINQKISDPNSSPEEPPELDEVHVGTPEGVPNGIHPLHSGPLKPKVPDSPETHRLQIGHIDPSRLVRRVQPIYPHLGVQLGRETRVELHAIIATDGSIQSLQVLSGDPLFYQSAIDAVSHWEYTPTILNGHAVEIDTHITVIYTLNR